MHQAGEVKVWTRAGHGGLGEKRMKQTGIAQLKKLRGRSLRELGVRGRQELAKVSERLRGTRELSDAELRREIIAAARNGSARGSAARLLEGRRSPSHTATFLPAFQQREAIVRLMAERFPAERAAIIERALSSTLGS